MDNDTFEQYTMSEEACGDSMKFLLENAVCHLLFWNGQTHRNDSAATGGARSDLHRNRARARRYGDKRPPSRRQSKTGAEVQVPAFISTGDKIKVDAQAGAYIETSSGVVRRTRFSGHIFW